MLLSMTHQWSGVQVLLTVVILLSRSRLLGELADLRTVLRNWWSFPAVGFNAVLEMPVYSLRPSQDANRFRRYKFEVTCPVSGEPAGSDDPPEEIGSIIGSSGADHYDCCISWHASNLSV